MGLTKKLKLKLGITAALLFGGAAYAGAQEVENMESDSIPKDKNKIELTTDTAKSIELTTQYGLDDLVSVSMTTDGQLKFWNNAMFSGNVAAKNASGGSAEIDALVLGMTDESGKTTFSTATFLMNLKQEFKGWNFSVVAGQFNAGGGTVFPKSGDVFADRYNFSFLGPSNKCTFMLEKDGVTLEVGAMGKADDGRIVFLFPKKANPFVRAGFAKAFNDAGGRIDLNLSYQAGKAKLVIGNAKVQDSNKGAKAMAMYSKNVGFKITGGLWTTINKNLLMLDISHINKQKLTQVAIAYDVGDAIQILGIVNLGKEVKTLEVGVSKRINIGGNKIKTKILEQKKKQMAQY